MANLSPESAASLHRQYRSACKECQRRKQKCNRVWPCDHCQKRKVQNQCTFQSTDLIAQKRSHEEYEHAYDNGDDLGISTFGYLIYPTLHHLGLLKSKEEWWSRMYQQQLDFAKPEDCAPLAEALRGLPTRRQMDRLMRIFLCSVNYHYYIIYPPVFVEQYRMWWVTKGAKEPFCLQWTALLLILCSCALQHVDVETRPRIELELGRDVDELSKHYLDLSTSLAQAIPKSHNHIFNIQRLLHTIYWYKAEARFPEAWVLIGEAVKESQELGLHKDSAGSQDSEFDREMRRRVWCILDTWDWQFASGLGQATLVNHTEVSVTQPTVTLEGFDPSPLLHMKLQSEVIAILAERFGAPKNVVTPYDILEYKDILETWIRSFPQVYSTTNPDRSKEEQHPWIVHHRFYIHTMAYLMILNPIRRFLAKSCKSDAPEIETEIQRIGIDYSLRNLDTTSQWTNAVSLHDGRFHFIIFSLFDTVSVLSAAILNDFENTMPRKAEVLEAIDKSVLVLKHLYALSTTAKLSYDILSCIVRRIPRRTKKGHAKRRKASPKDAYNSLGSSTGAAQGPVIMDHLQQYESSQQVSYGSEPTSSPDHVFTGSMNGSMTSESTPPSNHGSTPEYHLSTQPAQNVDPPYHVQQLVPIEGTYQPAVNVAIMPPTDPANFHQPTFTKGNPTTPAGVFTGVPNSDGYIEYKPPRNITDKDMGDFVNVWDWRGLSLDFFALRGMAPKIKQEGQ